LREALEGTLVALSRVVREVVPGMMSRSWGRICLVTASGVREPWPNMALSAASRAGLWGWAKALAHDLIDHNITLNNLCPGGHDPVRFRAVGSGGPAGDPDDFGQIVAFLCSEQANWISGVALSVDHGRTAALL